MKKGIINNKDNREEVARVGLFQLGCQQHVLSPAKSYVQVQWVYQIDIPKIRNDFFFYQKNKKEKSGYNR